MQGLLWTAGSILVSVSMLSLSTPPEPLTDVDLGDDCSRQYHEFGDAPEEVLAYPGVPGLFPTCMAGLAPAGIADIACPPISIPPPPVATAGYVEHIAFGPNGPGNFWLGCFLSPLTGPYGVDGEPDGKMNNPSIGTSLCVPGLVTDCVELAPWLMSFDQDECYGDVPEDASLRSPLTFLTCTTTSIPINTANCGPQRYCYLNICVDYNADGDWNDNFLCPPAAAGLCAYEWAVKNALILLPPGCFTQPSPAFLIGPKVGPSWMRITISEDIAPDDYPWNGSISAGAAGTQRVFHNGETEDYPVTIDRESPTLKDTWGGLKIKYRP